MPLTRKVLQKTILGLHNDTFCQSILCMELFCQPKTMTRNKMFNRYFHSLVVHSAQLYRVVFLRSLNAENQERMFGAIEDNKCNFNNHPQKVVDNAIQRLHYEEKNKTSHFKEEKELPVTAMANLLPHRSNTSFSKAF